MKILKNATVLLCSLIIILLISGCLEGAQKEGKIGAILPESTFGGYRPGQSIKTESVEKTCLADGVWDTKCKLPGEAEWRILDQVWTASDNKQYVCKEFGPVELSASAASGQLNPEETEECKILEYNGPSTQNLNLLFVAANESITYQQLKQMAQYAISGSDGLFAFEPWKKNREKINIWVYNSDYKAGTDVYEHSAGTSSFYKSRCPAADAIVVVGHNGAGGLAIITSSRKAGQRYAQIPIVIVYSAVTDPCFKPVLLHELGHAIGQLRDYQSYPLYSGSLIEDKSVLETKYPEDFKGRENYYKSHFMIQSCGTMTEYGRTRLDEVRDHYLEIDTEELDYYLSKPLKYGSAIDYERKEKKFIVEVLDYETREKITERIEYDKYYG